MTTVFVDRSDVDTRTEAESSCPRSLSDLPRRPLLPAPRQGGWVYWRPGRPGPEGPGVLAIGQFDGVHRGHQALLGRARREAGRSRAAVGAITFDRHPMSLLAPDRQPQTIMRLDDKVQQLLRCGLDFVAVLTLSTELLRSSPHEFVDDFLVSALRAQTVVVGPNFRFGRGASGDPHLLASLGKAAGFEVVSPELTRSCDDVVSSTRVRAAMAAGDVEAATRLLGRPHAVRGRVRTAAGRCLRLSVSGEFAAPRSGTYTGTLSTRADDGARLTHPATITARGAQVDAISAGASGRRAAPGDEVTLHYLRRIDDRRL
jgi:riboflavin kinase/FMN adenylyltransferase